MFPEDRVRPRLQASQLYSRKALPPFEALRAFDAIARLGGIRRAAEYLCRDHGVISRHLRTIEDWTRTKLIDRKPGGSVPTEAGLRYHRQIATAIDSIVNATLDLTDSGRSPRLHIRCMPGFALHWLSPRIGEFEQANPGLDIEVRPSDRSPGFDPYNTDVDIRLVALYGAPFEIPAEFRSIELVRLPIVPVASREYLARGPEIREPRDLLNHQLLHEEGFGRWRNWLDAHGVRDEVELTGPRLWQSHLTLDVARHGRGIALSNGLICAEDLAAGRVIEIGRNSPLFLPPALGALNLIAKADRWNSRVIKRFRDWLTARILVEHPQLSPERRSVG